MAVYTIYNNTGEDHISGFKFLDGDMKQVLPVGFEFHPGIGAARLPDRTWVEKKEFYQGVRVDPTHLPTRVVWKGPKRQLTDIQRAHNIFLVSDRFRRVVEELEPEVHQFSPVELVWEDGTPAASFFWFYPIARVDGMDREYTTHEFREKSGIWKNKPGGTYVVNLRQTGDHNIWIDPRMSAFDFPFVSEAFKKAMDDAGVTGVGYHNMSTI